MLQFVTLQFPTDHIEDFPDVYSVTMTTTAGLVLTVSDDLCIVTGAAEDETASYAFTPDALVAWLKANITPTDLTATPPLLS